MLSVDEHDDLIYSIILPKSLEQKEEFPEPEHARTSSLVAGFRNEKVFKKFESSSV